jgi:hypothetical protein
MTVLHGAVAKLLLFVAHRADVNGQDVRILVTRPRTPTCNKIDRGKFQFDCVSAPSCPISGNAKAPDAAGALAFEGEGARSLSFRPVEVTPTRMQFWWWHGNFSRLRAAVPPDPRTYSGPRVWRGELEFRQASWCEARARIPAFSDRGSSGRYSSAWRPLSCVRDSGRVPNESCRLR